MGHLYEFFIRSEINLVPVSIVTQRRRALLNGIAVVGTVLLCFSPRIGNERGSSLRKVCGSEDL
jgi:hypothetical protein